MFDESSMLDPSEWTSRRWITLGGVAALGLVLALFVSSLVGGSDLDVSANWPSQLSVRAEGTVPVTVRDDRDRPVEDASVELHYVPLDRTEETPDPIRTRVARRLASGETRRLASTSTDDSGFASLALPPSQEFADLVGDAQEDEAQEDEAQEDGASPSDPEVVPLAIRVRGNWDEAILQASLPRPKRADLALTADRPLYEPGQTMLLRLAAVAPIAGSPVEGEVRWEIRDPRDNVVFRESSATSDFGIASTRFELADRAAPGRYTIRAKLAGSSVERTVDVRHFRLPRFEVDVTSSETAHPGETLRGEVRATYTWGAPVEGGDVKLDVTAPGPGEIRIRERITGETDETGVYAFEWSVPHDTGAGGGRDGIELRATVSTEAGRTEEGRARVPVRAGGMRFEVLPTRGAADADFLFVLRDGDGEPIAEADVTIRVPEQKRERTVELTTDSRGLGTFEWDAAGWTTTLRVRIDAPNRESFRETVEVSRDDIGPLSLSRSSATVGESLEFHLPSSDSGTTVYLAKRGVPLQATHVPPAEGRRSGSLTVPPGARGLAHVVAVGEHGYQRASAPIWVRQRTGEGVSLEAGRGEYRPGDEADLELSYPASASEGATTDDSPVAFALFGVDEALYALEERTDLSLPRLLHESAEAAGAASRAFDALGSAGTDESETRNGRLLASARFYRELGEHANAGGERQGRDFTREVAAATWRLPYTIFSLIVGLAALVLLLLAGRMPLARIRALDLDVRTLATSFGIFAGAFLGLVVFGAILAGLGGGGAIFGGGAVWLVTSVGFFIDALRRHEDLHLGAWLGMVLAAVAVLLAAALPWLSNTGTAPVAPDLFAVLGFFGGVVLLLQIAAWVVVLSCRDHWSSTAGMVTLFWLLVAGAVAVALGTCSKMRSSLSGGEAERHAAQKQKKKKKLASRRASAATGESAADAASGGPRVRDYFPETMVWEPEIRSDANGRAELSVKMPDSITTWRLTAMAQTRDGRFAQSDHSIVVRKPMFANVELPEHVTAGDRIDVPISVSNDSGETITVELEAETEGALRTGMAVGGAPDPDSVSLQPGSRRTVHVTVVGDSVGTGALVVRADPLSETIPGDAVRRSTQVRPDGRMLAASSSGIVGEKWTATLDVPREAIPETVDVETAISGSAVADAFEGLEAMLHRPSGCFEQVASTNYPNAMILRRLESTQPKDWPGGEKKWREARERAERLLSIGYQKMLAFQTSDGGFRIYPDEDLEPNAMLTAYGVMQLAAMDEVMGIDLRPVMRDAAEWLERRQNQTGTWPIYASRLAGGRGQGEDVGQVRSTAFVAWALLELPKDLRGSETIDRALEHVEEAAADVSDPNALAVAANALVADGRDEAAAAILDRLASSAERDDRGAYWSPTLPTWIGGSSRYADTETTAIAAHAFSAAESHADVVGETLKFLAAARSPRGGWGTTQATVWSLRAFETLREASSEEPANLKIYAGGRPMARATGEGEPGTLRLEPGDQRLVRFGAAPEEAGAVPVRVESSPSTGAMARATAHYAVPWDSPRVTETNERAAFELGIEIDDRGVRLREPVPATAVVRNRSETPHGATIVELPIPPGGWVDRQQFDDLKEGGTIDHYEVLPTHVRLYLSGVEPRERMEFRWSFTPALRGDYSLPPIRAYPFYAPRPRAEVDGGDLSVVSGPMP